MSKISEWFHLKNIYVILMQLYLRIILICSNKNIVLDEENRKKIKFLVPNFIA